MAIIKQQVTVKTYTAITLPGDFPRTSLYFQAYKHEGDFRGYSAVYDEATGEVKKWGLMVTIAAENIKEVQEY